MRNTVKSLSPISAPSNLIGNALRAAKTEMKDLLGGDAGRDEAKMRRLTDDIVAYQRALDILHGYVVTEDMDPGR